MEGFSFSERENIIRLAQFFFKRESEVYRQDLQENVIEYAICLSNNKGIDFQELSQIIKNKIGVKFPSDLLIQKILKRCLEKGKVVVKNSKFFLSKERYNLIEGIKRNRLKTLEKLEKEIIRIFYKNYPNFPEDQKNLILDLTYKIFSRICISNIKIVRSILSSEFVVSESEITPISVLFEESLKKFGIKDKEFDYALRKTIQELFMNIEFSDVLIFLIENYLYIELLNLDPELHMIEKELLHKRVLILDTNVLISLLIKSDCSHEITISLVNLMKELGVCLVYTERSKKELINTLEAADVKYKELSSKIKREIILRNVRNVYISDFYSERSKNPSLTWEGYYLTLKNTFENRLSNYGLSPFKIEEFSIDTELFEYVKNYVYEAGLKVGNPKDPDVVEHDAYHILLIRELRKMEEKDPLGPLTWFLTYDTSLYLVDKRLNDLLQTNEAYSSIEVDTWLSFVTPFIPLSIEEKELPELYSKLMQTIFATIPAKFESKDLLEITGPWINYESLSLDAIYQILHDAGVRNLLKQIEDAKGKEPEEQREELKRKLDATVEIKVLNQLNDEISKLKNDFNQIKKKEIMTNYKLKMMGLAFWILIAIFTLQSIKNLFLECLVILLSAIVILFITGTIDYIKAVLSSKELGIEVRK